MHTFIYRFVLGVLLAVPSIAFQSAESIALGDDHFLAGRAVTFNGTGADDLFMAGETVSGLSDISGSAHLAGRGVRMLGAVGGDAYLAGFNIELAGVVTGDATLAGYDARVGEVGGDLRFSGGMLVIAGPIGGYAIIAGDDVRIEGTIQGDVLLASNTLSFSDDARIGGKLILYEEEPGKHRIPASVVGEGQIERRDIEEWEDAVSGLEHMSWEQKLLRYLLKIVVVAGLATLAAGIAPQRVAELRRAVLRRPGRTLMRGFFVESAAFGSCILFALTVIGIVLIPVSLLIALVLGAAGYVVAVYALGVWLWLAFGQPEPNSLGMRAMAAVLGALVARSIALVPYLGWLTFIALTLVGVGAISRRWFRTKPVIENAA